MSFQRTEKQWEKFPLILAAGYHSGQFNAGFRLK